MGVIKTAVTTMKVPLFSNANDALGISNEMKFTIVHTMSAVNANIIASEPFTWMIAIPLTCVLSRRVI